MAETCGICLKEIIIALNHTAMGMHDHYNYTEYRDDNVFMSDAIGCVCTSHNYNNRRHIHEAHLNHYTCLQGIIGRCTL